MKRVHLLWITNFGVFFSLSLAILGGWKIWSTGHSLVLVVIHVGAFSLAAASSLERAQRLLHPRAYKAMSDADEIDRQARWDRESAR